MYMIFQNIYRNAKWTKTTYIWAEITSEFHNFNFFSDYHHIFQIEIEWFFWIRSVRNKIRADINEKNIECFTDGSFFIT